jgi:RHS repeat-associated protein
MTAVYTCTYDAWNRLVKVLAGETTVAEYRYDGLGRRIRKYTDKSGDNWTVREYYYNVSWQTLQIDKDTEDRTGGVEPAVADVLNEQYVWSLRYVDAPILRDRDSDSDGDPDDGDLGKTDSGLDERLYYLTDVNMNVTALVDTGGDAVERYTYDAYGRVTIYDGTWTNTQSAATYANEVLYCGYRYDSETGLYHVRNRMYHPLLGRWLTRDPLGYVDGMSLYEYCRGNPATKLDGMGLATSMHGALLALGADLTIQQAALVAAMATGSIVAIQAAQADLRRTVNAIIDLSRGHRSAAVLKALALLKASMDLVNEISRPPGVNRPIPKITPSPKPLPIPAPKPLPPMPTPKIKDIKTTKTPNVPTSGGPEDIPPDTPLWKAIFIAILKIFTPGCTTVGPKAGDGLPASSTSGSTNPATEKSKPVEGDNSRASSPPGSTQPAAPSGASGGQGG